MFVIVPGDEQYADAILYERFSWMKASARGWKLAASPFVEATYRVRRNGSSLAIATAEIAITITGTKDNIFLGVSPGMAMWLIY